jgi:hypothetical protein
MAEERRSWFSAMGKPGRNRMRKDKAFRLACHEAAHAVASFHWGLGFREMCIRGGGPRADAAFAREGKSRYGVGGLSSRAAMTVHNRTRDRYTEENVYPEICMMLAGCALECFLDPRHGTGAVFRLFKKDDGIYRRYGESFGDLQRSMDLLRLVFPDALPEGRDATIAFLRREAADIVLDNWELVVALGTALLDRGHLTYAEAIEVLMEA